MPPNHTKNGPQATPLAVCFLPARGTRGGTTYATLFGVVASPACKPKHPTAALSVHQPRHCWPGVTMWRPHLRTCVAQESQRGALSDLMVCHVPRVLKRRAALMTCTDFVQAHNFEPSLQKNINSNETEPPYNKKSA